MEGNVVSTDCGFGLSPSLAWKLCICGVISDKKHEHTFSFLCSAISSVTSQKGKVQMDVSHLRSEEWIVCQPSVPLPWGLWEFQDCGVILPLCPVTPHSELLDLHWGLWPTQAMWYVRSSVGLWATAKTNYRLEIRKKKHPPMRTTQPQKQTGLRQFMQMNPIVS